MPSVSEDRKLMYKSADTLKAISFLNSVIEIGFGIVLVILLLWAVAKNVPMKIPLSSAQAMEQVNFVPTIPADFGKLATAQPTDAPTPTPMPTDAPANVSYTNLPTKTNGKFWWDSKPELKMLSYDQLSTADQTWCNWLSEGVKYTHEYLDGNGAFHTKTENARPSKEVCAIDISIEAAGGVLASYSMALGKTECNNATTCVVNGAGAGGPNQFLESTFSKYKPWPEASRLELLDSTLAQSNMSESLGMVTAFKSGSMEEFVKEFACIPMYKGCKAWNMSKEQAHNVYRLGWILQTYRQSMKEKK